MTATTITDLPPECRNMIFAELLHNGSQVHHGSNPHALWAVSKQLHNESTTHWYNHSVITMDSTAEPSFHATILPPIPDQYLPYLRRFTMHILTGRPTTPGVLKTSKLIASLSDIGKQLEEVTFVVSTQLSNLLNTRVDDAIMHSQHPVTTALYDIFRADVAKKIRINLNKAWFAMGIAHDLAHQFGPKVEFMNDEARVIELDTLEKEMTGRYWSSHLAALNLGDRDIAACSIPAAASSSKQSTPSSLPTSLYTAFSDLQHFSVDEYEFSSPEEGEESAALVFSESLNEPFFTEEDIEEWSPTTQTPNDDVASNSNSNNANDYLELDELDDIDASPADLSGVAQDEIDQIMLDQIMHNLHDSAQHRVNQDDITYLTNFAPELLLKRHQME